MVGGLAGGGARGERVQLLHSAARCFALAPAARAHTHANPRPTTRRCVIHYQLPASVDVYVHRSGECPHKQHPEGCCCCCWRPLHHTLLPCPALPRPALHHPLCPRPTPRRPHRARRGRGRVHRAGDAQGVCSLCCPAARAGPWLAPRVPSGAWPAARLELARL